MDQIDKMRGNFIKKIFPLIKGNENVKIKEHKNFIFGRIRNEPLLFDKPKIYISSISLDAGKVLEAVIPILLYYKCQFKCVLNEYQLDQRNSSYTKPKERIGQFITIYGVHNGVYLQLVQHLHQVTRTFRGPRIVSANPVASKSLVHHDYSERQLVSSDQIIQTQIHPEQSPIGTKYQIIKTLFQRAKGGIYIVEEAHSSRWMILKEARRYIGTDKQGRDVRDRLRNEKFFFEKLTHIKEIPNVMDFFSEDGNDYLVMTYMKGYPLRQFVHKKIYFYQELMTEFAARILIKVCKIVQKGHISNCIWRDLSPNNILLDGEGVHIIDLEAMYSEEGPFVSPFKIGTNGYYKNRSSISPAADIFSLGSILYFLVTGSHPFCNQNQHVNIETSLKKAQSSVSWFSYSFETLIRWGWAGHKNASIDELVNRLEAINCDPKNIHKKGYISDMALEKR